LNAELVPLDVLHHRPDAGRIVEVVEPGRPDPDEAIHLAVHCNAAFLLVCAGLGDGDVEMDPVLDRLAFRNPLEQDPGASPVGVDHGGEVAAFLFRDADRVRERVPRGETLGWWLDDVAERFGPKLGDRHRVVGIEGDLEVACHACHITGMDVHVRSAVESDLRAINDIFNAHVVESHVIFECDPWDLERRRRWWDAYGAGEFVALVAERSDEVVGVAYTSPYRSRPAYATSVQTTVLLEPAYTGRGIGRLLMEELLDRIGASGAHRAYAIIALPNAASVALHEKLGFAEVGVLDEVGHKLGRYWSTVIMEKRF
jgi:phosphinothricin acetyltransferase